MLHMVVVTVTVMITVMVKGIYCMLHMVEEGLSFAFEGSLPMWRRYFVLTLNLTV